MNDPPITNGRPTWNRSWPVGTLIGTISGCALGGLIAPGAGGGAGGWFLVSATILGAVSGTNIDLRSDVLALAFFGALAAGLAWASITTAFMVSDGPGKFIHWNVSASFCLGSGLGAIIGAGVATLGKLSDKFN